eukprot:IDg5225t1
MPRVNFYQLLAVIQDDLERDGIQAFRSSGGLVDPAARLAITLRLLARGSYLDLMMIFKVGRSTIYSVFHLTVDALMGKLDMPGIDFGDQAKLKSLTNGFEASRKIISPLYRCVGALDRIAIQIAKPND